MKKFIQISLASVSVFLAGVLQTNAAATNVVQHINFQLTFIEQGPTNHPTTNTSVVTAIRIKVITKDIIGALGQATSNSFSAKASLVRVISVNSGGTTSTIQVRDGTNKVDVTPFFAGTFTTNEVKTSRYNSTTGILNGIRYGILHLDVENAAPYNLIGSLKLEGLATTTHTDIVSGHQVIGVEEVQATLVGTGVDENGVDAVVSGTISIIGRTTVVE